MKGLLASTIAALLLAAALAGVPAEAPAAEKAEEPVIRYGAYCAAPYGFRHRAAGAREAVGAMKAFFGRKGLDVEVRGRGHRFIVADVFKEGEKVDTIVLDRLTGKMRSIY